MKNIIKRLSFIRYLYDFAIRQSYKPYPNSIISLLLFHDSIEHFNIFALEYKVDIKKETIFDRKKEQNLSFLSYWEILHLTQRESMVRLNKARVNLKHYGNWPSEIDIESFRASVTNFFEENTNKIFDIDFSAISFIDLINDDEVRGLVKESQAQLLEKNIGDSLVKLALARAKLFRNADIIICESLPSIRLSDIGLRDLKNAHKMDSYFKKLKESIDSIKDAMKCNILGIDYQRYLKFKSIIPHLSWTFSGEYYVYWHRNKFDIDEVNFCIEFVIETALSIQNYIKK